MRGYRRVRAVRETRGAKNFGCEFDGYKMRPPKLRENHIWEERGGQAFAFAFACASLFRRSSARSDKKEGWDPNKTSSRRRVLTKTTGTYIPHTAPEHMSSRRCLVLLTRRVVPSHEALQGRFRYLAPTRVAFRRDT